MNETDSASPPEGAIPRRGFLKIGLIGTAVAAVGGVSLALREGALREVPAGGLKVFTAREYSILTILAERIVPSTGPELPSPTRLDVARAIDEMFSRRDAQTQKEFRSLLGLYDNALFGFVMEGRITPFTKLSPEAQDASLASWETSGIAFKRIVFAALRRLIGMVYYTFPETWKHIGYDGPPTEAAKAYLAANRAAMQAEASKAAALPTPEEQP